MIPAMQRRPTLGAPTVASRTGRAPPEVRFGIRITGVAGFLGIPLVAAEGEVIVRVQPFELQTNAYTRLLGIQVSQVNVRVTSRSFTLNGQLELQIARSTLTLAFGFDAENEFTAYGGG